MSASAPTPSGEPPRVLIIRRHDVADIILLAPLLQDLRTHWPRAELHLLVDRTGREAAGLHATADQIWSFPSRLPQWPAFWRALRAAGFTHVVDLDNGSASALVARLSRAPLRVTYNRPPQSLRHAWIYHQITRLAEPTAPLTHITKDFRAAISAWDVAPSSGEGAITPNETQLERAGSLVAGPRSRVGVHVGSLTPALRWPTGHFATLCDRLQDELDAQVFLVGGKRETPAIEKIRADAETHLTRLDPRLSLGDLAAVIARFDVLVCHEGVALQLAAAVGTPVVVLFGGQGHLYRRPLGTKHAVLQPDRPCPCFPPDQLPKPCIKSDGHQSYCVRHVDGATVFDAVARLLSQPSRSL